MDIILSHWTCLRTESWSMKSSRNIITRNNYLVIIMIMTSDILRNAYVNILHKVVFPI